jgi:regulator of nonsense transcripts 1
LSEARADQPPGTGKTRTIIEAIKLLKLHWKLPHPILVTAHTNAAVDNLLAGLTRHGLQATRAGNTERVRPELAKYHMDEQMEGHPLYPEYMRAVDEVESCQTQIRQAKAAKKEGARELVDIKGESRRGWADAGLIAQVVQARKLARQKKMQISRDLLLDADVVSGSAGRS